MQFKKCFFIFCFSSLIACSSLSSSFLFSCSSSKINIVELNVIGSAKNITLSNYEYVIGKQFQTTILNISDSDNISVNVIVGKQLLVHNVDFEFNNITDILTIKPSALNGSDVLINVNLVEQQTIVPFNMLDLDDNGILYGFKKSFDAHLYNKLVFPQGVFKVNRNAFANILTIGVSNITEIELNEGLEIIDEYAFFGCNNLTCKIILPSTLSTIKCHAFDGCSNLCGSITFPEKLKEIEDSAFFRCSSLRGNLYFPNDLTKIGDHAFSRTNFDGELRLPSELKFLGQSAFSFCQNLRWNFVFPTNIDIIPAGLFANCKSIVGELKINDNIKSIEDSAFTNCCGLTKVDFHNSDSMTNIGKSAFKNCTNLTTITKFSENLDVIDDFAFDNCTNLSSILKFPDKLSKLGRFCFSECTKIPEIILNADLDKISEKAFYNCSSIKKINKIPPRILEIGDEAFSGCSNMVIDTQNSKFLVPSDMQTIGKKAFYNCSKLNMEVSFANLQNNDFLLGDSSFENAFIKNTIAFSSIIKNIPDRCFYNCNALTDMSLSASCQKIGQSVCENCTNLSILFPQGEAGCALNSIDNRAFANVKCVYNIMGTQKSEFFYIYNSIHRIGDYAFYNVNRGNDSPVRTLFISSSPTSIGKCAFAGWKNLNGINIEINRDGNLPIWLNDEYTFDSEIFKDVYPQDQETGYVTFTGYNLPKEKKDEIFNKLINTRYCALPNCWKLRY